MSLLMDGYAYIPTYCIFSIALFLLCAHDIFTKSNALFRLDDEYHIMSHPEAAMEKEREFQRRNAQYKPENLPASFDGEAMISETSPRQLRKDKKMAKADPQAYCAERCVSTGNCDVYEDVFDFSPEEVMAFCTDCVLSTQEEPCEVPAENMDAFFESISRIEDGGLRP